MLETATVVIEDERCTELRIDSDSIAQPKSQYFDVFICQGCTFYQMCLMMQSKEEEH